MFGVVTAAFAACGAKEWAAVYVADDNGEQFELWPDNQPIRTTAQLFADGAQAAADRMRPLPEWPHGVTYGAVSRGSESTA